MSDLTRGERLILLMMAACVRAITPWLRLIALAVVGAKDGGLSLESVKAEIRSQTKASDGLDECLSRWVGNRWE